MIFGQIIRRIKRFYFNIFWGVPSQIVRRSGFKFGFGKGLPDFVRVICHACNLAGFLERVKERMMNNPAGRKLLKINYYLIIINE